MIGSQENNFPACGLAGRELGSGRRFCRDDGHPNVVTPEICRTCPLVGCAKPTKRKRNPPKSPDMTCIYRGPQVSTVGCTSCGGQVDVAVFACVLHEDCTLQLDAGGGTAICRTCGDRSPMLVQLG